MKKPKPLGDIRIRANYSFWRHPIKWLRERKMRKLMEVMINHDWKNGGEERHQKMMKELILKGTVNIKDYL